MSDLGHLESRRAIIHYARRMQTDGLVTGTAGNISVRVGDDEVLITPTSIPYADLEPADICLVDINGRRVAGGREPSSETPFHTLVYRETDAKAVVHTHATYCTAVACCLEELPPIHYAVCFFGGHSVGVAPYARFGSEELAEGVRDALGNRSGALLQNHGAVTHGQTLERAFEAMVLLEWCCEVYWRAKLLGEPSILTSEQIEDVITERNRRRYAMGPGA